MDADAQECWKLFQSLYPKSDELLAELHKVPYLAHYTSIEVLEKILTTNEVWFSNPLFMNDLEEVRFGIVQGAPVLRASAALLQALGSDKRRSNFTTALDHYFKVFEQDHALDTYVFCLSKHDADRPDGQLSMWRGYGGNGRGAAIILDTSKFAFLPGSPLILSKVEYGSTDQRLGWIEKLGQDIAKIIAANGIPDDNVYLVAHTAFERLKLFALFSKHIGFAEEQEWRVIYMPDRDEKNVLKPMLGYVNGAKGVEPKLKLKVAPLPGALADGITLGNLIAGILLGPTTSSVLAQRSISRMLDLIGKPELKDRVTASTIPLRER